MPTVPATEFKAKCLELMDRVAERRATYVITKRGRPVAKLVPADPPRKKTIFGCMADQTTFVGDIEILLDTHVAVCARHAAAAAVAASDRRYSAGGSP
jgi:prevent-host-death family protein